MMGMSVASSVACGSAIGTELGLRGSSVLVASGDAGVGRGDCKDDDGNDRFCTTFPASCMCLFSPCKLYTGTGTSRSPDRRNFAGPWVTCVGGTRLDLSDPEGPVEVANSFSGSGFSALFPPDVYQKKAVPTFLGMVGNGYDGLYKYVRSRGLTQPILTM
jgi:tripeptidyl-peptidase-1